MTEPATWHLLIHTPGPNADPSVPFFQAPWFPLHRKLHVKLAESGYLIAAGPLPGRPGAGQTLVHHVSLDDLTWLATEYDKAVAGGFLEVEIVPWTIVDSIFDDEYEDEDEEADADDEDEASRRDEEE